MRPPLSPAWLPWASLLLSACAEPATFSLELVPIFATNQQSELDRVASWELTLDYPAPDEPETYPLELDSAGYARIEHLPALPDGTAIEVSGLEESGSLLFHGRTEPLSLAPDAQATVKVLVTLVDDFFTLENLDQALWGGALAPDGKGHFYLFGGLPRGVLRSYDPSGEVLELSLTEPEEPLGFHSLGQMQDLSTEELEFAAFGHATATLLTQGSHEHLGQILVLGGWDHYDSEGFPRYLEPEVSYEGFYFDPDDLSIEPIHTEDGEPAEMVSRHAMHRTVELLDGTLVVFGGFPTADLVNVTSRVELFDPATGEFTSVGTDPDVGLVYGDAVALGDKAMYCGGIEGRTSGSWQATNKCVFVKNTGALTLGTLPGGVPNLLLPAMAVLPDGLVLVIGGLPDVRGQGVEFEETVEATDAVWAWNDETGTWSQKAPLNHPRAGHRAVTLPDGRVLVMGGATAMSALRDNDVDAAVDALACAEIFDPRANNGGGSWTDVGHCDASTGDGVLPGKVILPSVAADPNYGVVVAGGLDERGYDAVPYATYFAPAPEAADED